MIQALRYTGPLVRYGPNRIVVNTTEGLQKIYGIKANTRKSSYYNIFKDLMGGENSQATIDQKKYLEKKRVISTSLSDRSLRSLEELALRNIRKFVQRLGESEPSSIDSHGWSSPKNLGKWAGYLTFDIMGDVCFSNSFGMVDDPHNRYLLEVLPQGVNGVNIVSECSRGR